MSKSKIMILRDGPLGTLWGGGGGGESQKQIMQGI